MASDKVSEFLRSRGCADDVVAAGLEGLVSEWERVVDQVREGYPLGLDDYLNDLDSRQMLEDALELAPDDEQTVARERVRTADLRMRTVVTPAAECLWGARVASVEGWNPERNWWYFNLPRSPGTMLREDLDR